MEVKIPAIADSYGNCWSCGVGIPIGGECWIKLALPRDTMGDFSLVAAMTDGKVLCPECGKRD